MQGDYKKTIPTFGPRIIIPFAETEWNFSIRYCEVCGQEWYGKQQCHSNSYSYNEKNFKNFKWQHPVFCIGMWSPLWKTLNSIQMASVARKSPELDKEKAKRTLPCTKALMLFSRHTVSSTEITAWLILHKTRRKKLRNTNFGFYIRHSHVRWKKRHCEMGVAYVAFCHSKEAAALRERTWGNRKDFLPEWRKCRTDFGYLPQKLWIMARSVHCQNCMGLD